MGQDLDMFETSADFRKLRKEVFSTFGNQFKHLADLQNLNAKFLGIIKKNDWEHICIEAQTKLGPVKIIYNPSTWLFSRNPKGMHQVDTEAGIAGRLQSFSDIEVIRLRVLYILFSTIKKVSQNKINIGRKLADHIKDGDWLFVFTKFSSGKIDYDWRLSTDFEV